MEKETERESETGASGLKKKKKEKENRKKGTNGEAEDVHALVWMFTWTGRPPWRRGQSHRLRLSSGQTVHLKKREAACYSLHYYKQSNQVMTGHTLYDMIITYKLFRKI